ncbi:sulfite exporter TauE/SafE family protein [Helicobacter sp. 11S03491-1]|uniref:sulfite exporter TauE/SafE family protein n=1 Tax=Helicobacter sp. 11S03491-1 TaxID=1476196 RepID=UPI000BA75A9E|nr:sulfite exporter TauE/SafE family protein [Helicobacter sp. 11S03491-1]PAF42252.1 hypothetical protein BKH45_04725 [Helicobacter sp. 11S03491-1]
MEKFQLLLLFTTALVMSLGHCVGMCGGIVIGYSNAKIHKNSSNFYQASCHILYSLGRITSYMIIGALSALAGHVISISMHAKGFLFIIIGIFLIIFAFLYIFFPKFLSYLEPSLSKNPNSFVSKYFKIIFSWLMTSKSLWSFYGLGMLNGFLPCGMVYYFGASAALAPNIFMGMVTMGVFGVATFIPMFILGFITGRVITSSFRNIFMKLSFVLMLCFGGYSIYKGILILQGKPMHMQHQNPHESNHSHHHMDMP